MMFLHKIGSYSKNAYTYMSVLGVALIVFGILLLIMPELLAYLISFFFILAGLIALSMGWKIRQTDRHIRSRVGHVTDNLKSGIHNIKDTFDQF